MEINKRHAEEIVETLRSVIHEDINFISPDGIIIASSDLDRVGSFHEGAVIVSQTKKPLVIKKNDVYKGTKKGINLPVFYEDHLMAIVGITGDESEIRQFSTVIVKMSEILIKEYLYGRSKLYKRENNRIIMELIMKEYSDPKFIYQQLKGLGYSYKDFHYFVVFDIQEYNQQDTELFNSIHNSFEKRIAFQDLFTRSQNQFYLLSKRETIDDLKHELTQLKQYVENKYNVHVGIGISQKIDNFDKVYKFVMQAQTVIDIFKVKRSSYIQQFEPSSLKFLFQGFAKYIPNDFSHYVLGDIEETEKEQIKELIYTYIKANGSIKLASEELFVHKNTFQYRLNKVKEQLGYNPRDLEDLIILYIALELDNK